MKITLDGWAARLKGNYYHIVKICDRFYNKGNKHTYLWMNTPHS